MEYVPRELREYFEYDQENNWELWLKINGEILEDHCCRTSLHQYTKFEKLLYALEWPGEIEKEEFENAKYKQEGFAPILLRGVVIDKIKREDETYVLQLVGTKARENFDEGALLHLRDCASVCYTLIISALYTDQVYTVSDFEEIRPGTKVVVAVSNLEISSKNKKWAIGQYTDIAEDKDAEYTYLDKNYRIQQSTVEFLRLYKKIATERKNAAKQQTNSSEGCYIATSVYGSYDCPEVWTLRRFRDMVLKNSCVGRWFIRVYYAISPTCVKWFGNTKWFRLFWKKKLDRLVNALQNKGIESNRYTDKM